MKVGIKAPNDINVLRKEVYEAVQESNKNALKANINLNELKNLPKINKK